MSKLSLPGLFLIARMILILSLPLEGLLGYGDLTHFYGWASLPGWPYLDYWMEFPPLFPFLAEVLYRMVGGREHAFYSFLVITFSLVEAGNLVLVQRIAKTLYPLENAQRRTLIYLAFSLGLFYGWTYFDPLVVFCLLAAAEALLAAKPERLGLALAAGGLLKWFPLLVLPAALKILPRRGKFLTALIALVIPLTLYSVLLAASPDFTRASLASQSSKGSWESVWALLDGNLTTGNFGAKAERLQPDSAYLSRGHPPRISPLVAAVPFAILGAWLWKRADIDRPAGRLAFVGLTFTIYFLWSPGWSPQWVLYLLPLILLCLPERLAVLMAFALVTVNLAEWPLLLSRGWFWGLWATIPLRTILLVLLAREFWKALLPEMKNTNDSGLP